MREVQPSASYVVPRLSSRFDTEPELEANPTAQATMAQAVRNIARRSHALTVSVLSIGQDPLIPSPPPLSFGQTYQSFISTYVMALLRASMSGPQSTFDEFCTALKNCRDSIRDDVAIVVSYALSMDSEGIQNCLIASSFMEDDPRQLPVHTMNTTQTYPRDYFARMVRHGRDADLSDEDSSDVELTQ